MSESKNEDNKDAFVNFKFLEEVRETPEYNNAKERIDLIEDIFSINEETFSKVVERLRKYLEDNEGMVQMFILVISIFVSTRFKTANKFGIQLFHFFKDNYKEKLKSLSEFYEKLFSFNRGILNDIGNFQNFRYFLDNDFTFYNFEEGTIPYFLMNDDIEGLQKYCSYNDNVDFNVKENPLISPTILELYPDPSNFEYSILFGAVKCFKYIMLNGGVIDPNRCTYYASASGNSEIIHILVDKNYSYNEDCLKASISFHRNEVFQWIIRNYISDLQILNDIMDLCFMCFNEEILYFALNNGASPNYKNSVNLYPIEYATITLNMPLVKFLYEECHVDISVVNDGTLLHYACRINQLDFVKYFIETCKIDIESKDSDGFKLLQIACMYGCLPIVEYLISQGADPNSEGPHKWTPLTVALLDGKNSIAKFLCENTNINLNCQDDGGCTALHYAYSNDYDNDNLEIIKCLIEHGADQYIHNNYGKPPCFYFFNEDNFEYLSFLNKDKLPTDSCGRTLLHYFSYQNLPKMINYGLSSWKMDKDIKDPNGRSPLHHACFNHSLDAVKYLISINADKDLKDNFGRTPLHYAYLKNYDDICEYLISIGADQTVKDINNYSPIELKNLKNTDEAKYEEIIETTEFDLIAIG